MRTCSVCDLSRISIFLSINGNVVQQRPAEFWEELLLAIPDKMIQTRAEASAENCCAIEVNAQAVFSHPIYSDQFKMLYVNLMKKLVERGELFTIGSDAHDIGTPGQSFYGEGILYGLGVAEEQIWRPEKE